MKNKNVDGFLEQAREIAQEFANDGEFNKKALWLLVMNDDHIGGVCGGSTDSIATLILESLKRDKHLSAIITTLAFEHITYSAENKQRFVKTYNAVTKGKQITVDEVNNLIDEVLKKDTDTSH